MATAQKIINKALRQLGVIASGDAPTPEEYNDSLDSMNDLIETWQADERAYFSQNDSTFTITTSTGQYAIGDSVLSITSITRSSATATAVCATRHSFETGNKATIAGAAQTDYNITAAVTVIDPFTFSYTVANTPASPATTTTAFTAVCGDIAIARPVELLGAFTRAGGVDNPLGIITERFWDGLSDKAATAALASKILYRPNYPFGQLLMYKIPTAAAVLHLKTRNGITSFTSLTQDQPMPPGYRRALTLAVAIDMAPEFGDRVQQETLLSLTNAYKTLWELNTKKPVSSKDNQRTSQAGAVAAGQQ